MWPYILFSPETSSFWLLKSCGRRVSKIAFNVRVLLSLFHSPLILCIKNMIFIMKLQWATDIMPRYLSLHASRHKRPWRLLLLGQNLSDVLTNRAVLSHREIYCDVNVVLRMNVPVNFLWPWLMGSNVYCLQSLYLYRSQEKSVWGFESYCIWIFTLNTKTQKRALKWCGWWEKSVKMQGCRSLVQSCSQPNVLNPCANKLAPLFALCFALFCWRFLLNWEQAHEKNPAAALLNSESLWRVPKRDASPL